MPPDEEFLSRKKCWGSENLFGEMKLFVGDTKQIVREMKQNYGEMKQNYGEMK